MKLPIYIIFVLIFISFLASCVKTNRPRKHAPHKDYEQKLIEINKYLVEKDQKVISDFVKEKGWNMYRDSAGMWYEILSQGNGPYPKDGDQVVIGYKIELLDGRVCYDSDSLGLKTFKINHSDEIRGLNDAVQMLRLGGTGRFIFPPYIAYGLLGDQKCIPPRSIVIYYIKLVEIK